MKKKIGEIYNIPIIIGDKNLKTKNEIHIDELSNVPTSGEGGGSASSVEYLDVSGASKNVKYSLVPHALYVKGYVEAMDVMMAGITLYSFGLAASDAIDSVSAIAIDFSNVVAMKMGATIQSMTTAEAVLQNGATQADIDALPRITEEEFYNLNA